MSKVTLAPYILTDPDGSNPRIVFPVSTPAAFVVVESRRPGSFVARSTTGDGVQVAVIAARAYTRAHQPRITRLYAQMERIAQSG